MSDDLDPAVKHTRASQKVTDTTPQEERSKAEEPASRPPANWPKELGGPDGPEPTRYGDWERKGRCSDF